MGTLQPLLRKSASPMQVDNLSWIVVGLGNPGPRYAATRHNAGFWVADELARALSAEPFREGPSFLATEATQPSGSILLLKPQTYMNLSGEAVRFAMQRLKAKASQLFVIHDDLDLPPGRIQLKQGGGHGGHNGLRSMFDCIGNREFLRLRLGIGRPTGPIDVADYVLQRVPAEQESLMTEAVRAAVEACLLVFRQGVQAAMNQVNQKQAPKQPKAQSPRTESASGNENSPQQTTTTTPQRNQNT